MGNIVNKVITNVVFRFPGGSDGKVSVCNAGDTGSIPGQGRSPEEGNGYPPQYSCLENPMDRGTWQATVHGVTESDVTEVTQPKHINKYKICQHKKTMKQDKQ